MAASGSKSIVAVQKKGVLSHINLNGGELDKEPSLQNDGIV